MCLAHANNSALGIYSGNRSLNGEIANATDYGNLLLTSGLRSCILPRHSFLSEDGCAATENILLAARDLGLGSYSQ